MPVMYRYVLNSPSKAEMVLKYRKLVLVELIIIISVSVRFRIHPTGIFFQF